MRYGCFDDRAREYVIGTPHTPLPWINYLGCERFFGLVSHTAGGYCFYRDARLRRLTRFRYNNVPRDAGGRCFYIREAEELWSPAWKPAMTTLDSFECRHGLGYTRIRGSRGGLEAELLLFVPLGVDAEVHRLQIRNRGDRERRFQVFSLVEFCLWNALEDMTNFQRNLSVGEVEVEGSVIYHTSEYRERRNHFAYYGLNREIGGFDTDREAFFGPDGSFARPAAVLAGRSADSVAHGWAPVASHRVDCRLAPGETETLIYLLGYAENGPAPEAKWEAPGRVRKDAVRETLRRFERPEAVERAFAELTRHWRELLSRFQVHTGQAWVDRMANVWNPYQCLTAFNLGRSASYFESGIGRGLGFRDTNQDLLGCVHLEPERARERILDVAATQRQDGSAYHQYQPLTRRGNTAVGGNFNDDPLWLVLAVSAYLKETGDWGILEQPVPFDHDPQRCGSLFEHLERSYRHVVDNRGPHGLPLIGRADWNDCLNLNCFSLDPDESFQTTANKEGRVAESVFIAGLFVWVGRELAEICRRGGRTALAEEVRREVQAMEQAVLEHGWDGQWYLRAYDDSGAPVGTREGEEGRIYIEPQGFCGMAEIGRERDYPRRALDAVREHLDCEHGLVLLWPAYTRYHPGLGEISSYPPGYKENGGVFCHNNPWVMIAEARLGRGERAFEYYRKICPAFREQASETHRCEPYVYAQMIAGKQAARPGEAKNSWLTGTAAWNLVALSQWILGLRPEYDGLRLDPCLPPDWAGFRVERWFRGAAYDIRIRNPHRVSRGVVAVRLDGQPLAGNLLPPLGDGRLHRVEALMGAPGCGQGAGG